jgi:hypothetical protein
MNTDLSRNEHDRTDPCCPTMRENLRVTCPIHNSPFACTESVIAHMPTDDYYGLIIHDGGGSVYVIAYCPWCGAKLPDPPGAREPQPA